MNWIDLEWEIITPMFLHGYENRKAIELRAPPVKSLMRYWWRALHGNFKTEILYKRESETFGAADENLGKSKFQLRILPYDNLSQKKYILIQKPKKIVKRMGISPGYKFKIRTQTHEKRPFLEKYILLQYLSLVLGGLGQRVRRGAGALKFLGFPNSSIEVEFDFERDILVILNDIIELFTDLNYELNIPNKRIDLDDNRNLYNFPYLKSIIIGKEFDNWEGIRSEIDKLCHNFKHKYKKDYNSMGFAFSDNKLASPLFISIIKENSKYNPIMSKLNPVFPNKVPPPADVDKIPNKFINNLS